ncbi:uncharacterized protein MKZ38_002275 [Zalerion maritima]|uniref:DUF3533 domain-containing protein n=1 Tax=Zalerion maritima TaxID=339359 RepID=A0AAD5RVW4_9PEZI|nr:uncharacterized protein MKZ38_002275 [Zalerion maritima]
MAHSTHASEKPAAPPGQRHGWTSTFWASRRSSFLGPLFGLALTCLVVFVANLSYMYGSMFRSPQRVHRLKILALDYDGGVVGEAMSAAYGSLEGDEFPTFEFRSTDGYRGEHEIREAICKEGYWGAIWADAGATARLEEAVNGTGDDGGGGGGGGGYDSTSAIGCMYSGVYYPIVASSYVQSSLLSLISAAGTSVYGVPGSETLFRHANLSSASSSAAFLNPISSGGSGAGCTVLAPTNQGMKALLNTATMVAGPLMQFFFCMGMNSMSGGAGVLSHMRIRDVYVLRLALSKAYAFLGGLCIAGCVWAFREDWSLAHGDKFALTWLCYWFYLDINYLVVDTVLVTIIPLAFFSFSIFTWIFVGITSSIWPFELSAGFYRWQYALPSHDVWILLTGVWSGGCRTQEEVTLPVLFAWWFVGHATSAWSVWRRCRMSEGAEEQGIRSSTAAARTSRAGGDTDGGEGEHLPRKEEGKVVDSMGDVTPDDTTRRASMEREEDNTDHSPV